MFSGVGRVRRTRFRSLIRNMARWGCGAFEVSHTAIAELGVGGCARDASTGWAVGGRDAVGGCGGGNAQAVMVARCTAGLGDAINLVVDASTGLVALPFGLVAREGAELLGSTATSRDRRFLGPWIAICRAVSPMSEEHQC